CFGSLCSNKNCEEGVMTELLQNDIFIKILLTMIGTFFTVIGVLTVWGFQKLITTLLDHSKQLLNVVRDLGEIKEKIAPIPKMAKDVNQFFIRIKNVEKQTGVEPPEFKPEESPL